MNLHRTARRAGPAALFAACVLAFSGPAVAGIDAFPGKWRNVDPSTNNLTKVHIDMAGPFGVDVHAWGQCHPTDCDWGTVHGDFIPGGGGTVHAKFNSGFSITNLELHNAPGQRLSYDMHVKFTDSSGRAPYEVHGMLDRAGGGGGMGGGGMGGGGMGGGGMGGGGMGGGGMAMDSFHDFGGHWHNVNPNTNNLTRLHLDPDGFPVVKAHGFGQCHPTDCDWGAVDGEFEPGGGGTVHVKFNSGFSITKLDLHHAPGGRLSYEMHVKFTDSSGRAPYDLNGWLEK